MTPAPFRPICAAPAVKVVVRADDVVVAPGPNENGAPVELMAVMPGKVL